MSKILITKILILLFLSLNSSVHSTDSNATKSQIPAEALPPGDTTGICSLQLNPQPHKKNCRYGKCEQIKNGTDFACHCDEFITGKNCDRPVKDPNDACSSNPCWGESECISDPSGKTFKCLCSFDRIGRHCQIKLNITMLTNSSFPKASIEKSLVPITTTKNMTNYEKSTISLKILSENYKIPTSLLTEPHKSFTFVPNMDNSIREKCNYDTCQLGKCLKNGTCECLHPAIGKYCDRIDECLILKCFNGNCVTGKGCVCEKGFMGAQCEVPMQTKIIYTSSTINSIIKNNATLTRKILPSKRPLKSNSTKTHKAKIKTTKSPEPKLLFLSESSELLSSTTPLIITSCENGGLLIDNACLCLNQYKGPRCELTPEQAILNENETLLYLATKLPSQLPKLKSGVNTELVKSQLVHEDNLKMLNKLNGKIDEDTSVIQGSESAQKRTHWPWFECFPGDSFVYTLDSLNQDSIKVKKMSDLKVDDFVLVNEADDSNDLIKKKFSKVITFLHRIENIDAKFVRLYYDDENFLTLTSKHLILAKKTNSNHFEYIAAIQVELGTELYKYDLIKNRNQLVKVKRMEILTLNSTGIFAPLTESGTLIVDNIYVSCYSLVKSHQAAQFFFKILFIIKKFVLLSSDACLDYAKYLYDFVEYFKLSEIFLNIKS